MLPRVAFGADALLATGHAPRTDCTTAVGHSDGLYTKCVLYDIAQSSRRCANQSRSPVQLSKCGPALVPAADAGKKALQGLSFGFRERSHHAVPHRQRGSRQGFALLRLHLEPV